MNKANALTITNLNYNPDVKTYYNILLHCFVVVVVYLFSY